ncbi:polysaccharide export protein, partial [Vibrio sp. OPT46]|nr:polysaccharide export protein [Vibrio sp. OPT46]
MKAFIKFMSVALLLFSTLVNADSNEEDYLLDTGDTISVQV